MGGLWCGTYVPHTPRPLHVGLALWRRHDRSCIESYILVGEATYSCSACAARCGYDLTQNLWTAALHASGNPSSSHLRSCLSPAVRHAYSRQIQPTDTAAAAALSPQWRWRPPPQLSRQPPLTSSLSDRPTHVVPGTPLQPARGCSSRMRWSVHGSTGVLLNEQLTGADLRPLCHPPYLLCPP